MPFINRILKIDLPSRQSAFLWGPRKTGKSTYLNKKFPESVRYNFLDTDLFLEFSRRPALLRERLSAINKEQLVYPVILDEVQKILKPGGTLHIGVPNQRSFAFHCYGEKWLNKGGHLYAFSPATLKVLCQKVGLSIERIRFKSSKGILINGLFFFLERKRFFKISILFKKNKVFSHLLRFLVIFLSPFLNLIHFSDTIIVEAKK